MKIDVVLTEVEIVQELSDSVVARDVPEKFFYWSPLSVRAWLALSAHPAFDGLRRCWKQLAANPGRLLEPFDHSIPLISFGAGDGATDRLLLDALRLPGRELKYYPVDASQALLEMACAGAEDLDIETAGIKADIASPMHLVFASDAAESPKLLLMSGNTLGGFDPADLVKQLAQSLHPGDRLALDAEIYQGDAPPPEQDMFRQFVFAPLAALGVSADEGEVRFDHRLDDRFPAEIHMTQAVFRPTEDLRVTLADREVLVERSEHWTLSFRYTFTPDAFRWLLEDHSGLRILAEIPSPDGRHVLAVCSK